MVDADTFAKIEHVGNNFSEVIMFLMTAAMSAIGKGASGDASVLMTREQLLGMLSEGRQEPEIDEVQRERVRLALDEASVRQLFLMLAANDVGLTPLTQKLTPDQIVDYILLIQMQDPRMQGLVGGLKGWMDELQVKMPPRPLAPGTIVGGPTADGSPSPSITPNEARSLIEATIGSINDSVRGKDYWFFQKSQIDERFRETFTQQELQTRCAWMEKYTVGMKIEPEQIVLSAPARFEPDNTLYFTGRVMNFPSPEAELGFEFWYDDGGCGRRLVNFVTTDAGPHRE